MPNFLADPAPTLYLMLAAALLVAIIVWFYRRDHGSLIGMGIVAVLLGVLLALDVLFESHREEAVRRAVEMGEAANAKNPEAFIAQMADTVEFRVGSEVKVLKREALRNSPFWGMLKQYNVRVTTWDFARSDVKELDENRIEIGFMAKGEADGKPYPLYIRASFAKQADGQMKLSAFSTFHPTNHNEPLSIPNFP